MKLDNQKIKHLRTLGHKLKPVVTVAGNGLSDNVVAEVNRALNDHELIKVSIKVGDRSVRQALRDQMCEQLNCQLVQSIGNIALIYRPAKKPNPALSNILRHLQ